jgi:hypothetical protein
VVDSGLLPVWYLDISSSEGKLAVPSGIRSCMCLITKAKDALFYKVRLKKCLLNVRFAISLDWFVVGSNRLPIN